MARIYVKPQVKSSNRTAAKPRPLDYSVIEQIANGIEKMVVSWNSAKECRLKPPPPFQRRSNNPSALPSSAAIATTAASSAAAAAASSAGQLDEAVQAGSPLFGESAAAAASNMATEMSIFVRSPCPLDTVIPNLSGIVREQQHCSNSCSSNYWFMKTTTTTTTTTSSNDSPTLPTAVDAPQEEGGDCAGAANSCGGGKLVENIPSCKEYSQLTERSDLTTERSDLTTDRSSLLDQAENTSDSNKHVDDWTETTDISGDEYVTNLIEYSSKKVKNKEKENLLDDYKVKVEELQIALLECSTEYEVKIVEMKMMMLHMKSKYREQQQTNTVVKQPFTESKDYSLVTSSQEKQRIEHLKKQMQKLKMEKDNLSHELFIMKKKQRQSEKQRRNLDDALNKVCTLRRELAKKEEEIIDSQLRERETKAQLSELYLALKNARAGQAEPGKLLSLVPILRNWLRSVKKDQYSAEARYVSNVENYPPSRRCVKI